MDKKQAAVGVISQASELRLPDLQDSNRNQVLKKLAEELASSEVLAKLKEDDPTCANLDVARLTELITDIENEMWERHPDNYFRFARERVLMLKNKSNQQLKFSLLQAQLSVEDFVTKEPNELESAEKKKVMEAAHNWKMQS